VYDLIYNPARTQFLQKAEMRGSTIKNGLEMLHIQAEKSWQIWNN
jgi:shikimate dehydrogenase